MDTAKQVQLLEKRVASLERWKAQVDAKQAKKTGTKPGKKFLVS